MTIFERVLAFIALIAVSATVLFLVYITQGSSLPYVAILVKGWALCFLLCTTVQLWPFVIDRQRQKVTHWLQVSVQ